MAELNKNYPLWYKFCKTPISQIQQFLYLEEQFNLIPMKIKLKEPKVERGVVVIDILETV